MIAHMRSIPYISSSLKLTNMTNLKLSGEIWKPVNGYEKYYQVSSLGRVRSLDRIRNCPNYISSHIKGKILKPVITPAGYDRVTLSVNNNKKQKYIHRLMAIEFIPNPDNYPQINHKDGNPRNNALDNLEWCTAQQNVYHAASVLKTVGGENNGKSKLTENQVRRIRWLHTQGLSYSKISTIFNVTVPNISTIVRRKTWKYI